MSLSDYVKRYVAEGFPSSLTAEQIMDQKCNKLSHIVPGIIPQGVTLLVSSPKQGKSFLCLELALAVATGGKVLGLDVEAHEVLYLALEDTRQRVHDRLANMLQGASAPEQLRFMFQWMRGNGSEFNSLRQWLETYPGTRLIIIDTLVKFSSWKQNNYNADYQHISKFKAIADRYKIALILVHHLRKTEAKDICDRMSGSNGLLAGADTSVILDRQRFQGDATLRITGRDLANAEMALKFNDQTCSWEVKEGEENNMTPERQEIVKLLKKASTPSRLQDIAMALGKNTSNIANLLSRLTKQGVLEKVSYGKYQIKDKIR